jgi:hypothetical protein
MPGTSGWNSCALSEKPPADCTWMNPFDATGGICAVICPA